MKLIYVNSGDSSVMQAQVVSLIEYYSEMDKFKKIILLQGYKGVSERNVIKRKIEGFKPTVSWFRTWPEYTIFQSIAFFSLSRALCRLQLDDQTIIHVRGELYGYYINRYLKKNKSVAKLLVDFRGVTLEEIEKYYLHNKIFKKNKLVLFNKSYNEVKDNISISVVSEAFRRYLIEKHGFQKQNICVHPNIAGEQFSFSMKLRKKIRNELGFGEGDIIAICASSGKDLWQKDTDVIKNLLALKIKVINLSKRNQEIPGTLNRLVSFDLMPGYLAAADIAVLWRDNCVVNEVASPSKFSEFASMGLWVIHNGTVKLATDYIVRNKSGIIVNSLEEINGNILCKLWNYNRNHYSTLGRKSFGVENVSRSYLKLYASMLQG